MLLNITRVSENRCVFLNHMDFNNQRLCYLADDCALDVDVERHVEEDVDDFVDELGCRRICCRAVCFLPFGLSLLHW